MKNGFRRNVAGLVLMSFSALIGVSVTQHAGNCHPTATTSQVLQKKPEFSQRLLLDRITKANQLTQEEVEFIEAFAYRLSHAITEVASNPDKSYPEQSLAGRVRTAFVGLDTGKRTAMQKRARAILSKSVDERQRYIGAQAAKVAEAQYLSAGPGLDAEMKVLLRRALEARMKVLRSGTGKLKQFLTTKPYAEIPKTRLEGGFFEEPDQRGKKQLTLNEPVLLNFRWNTFEEGAGQGLWQLLRVSSGGPAIVLASGISEARKGDPVNGRFDVDLRKFLPPNPEEEPTYYYVRILPQLKQKTTVAPEQRLERRIKVQTKPEVTTKPKLEASGSSITAVTRGVGPWSAPVIIAYCKASEDAWGQHPRIGEMYKNVGFYLDSIIMVEDQYGPGNEEFHVAGFIQEFLPTNSKRAGKRVKRGRYFAELEPEPGDSEKFGKEAWFDLSDLDESEWPRSYIAMFTIMEEDDGGEIADWSSRFWDISKETMDSDMGDMIRDILEEYKDELIKQGIELADEVASLIVSAITNPIMVIVAAIVIVVVKIVIDVVSDMPDDFYGIEFSNLVLPYNDAHYIEHGPTIAERHPRGAINLSTGFFEISEKMQFLGSPAANDASSFDGIVDLSFRWRFKDKVIY
jgi:hypothetical protein